MVNAGYLHRDTVSRLISWGHWFTFFNIVLALLIALRYITANPWPDTGLGMAYLVISWLGHFGFIGFLAYLLTVFPLSFAVTNQRVLRLISVFIATLVMTLLLIDTQIYQVFKFHINPVVWDVLLEQAQTKSELHWNALFISVPLFFVIELLISSHTWRMQFRRRPRGLGSAISALFVISFLLTHLTHIWADANLYTPITAQKATFPLSYPMTARSFLAKHGWLDLDAYKQARLSDAPAPSQRLIYPLTPLVVDPPQQRLNVLLVVVNGLRSDMLNNINMPNLYRFAEQHTQFRQHLGGDNRGDTSLFSLFYGLSGQYLPLFMTEQRPPLLLDELQRQDYLISAFASEGLSAPVFRNAILAGVRQMDADHADDASQGDADTLAQWRTWLLQQSGERPWFSFLALNGPGTMSLAPDLSGPFQPQLTQMNPVAAFDDQHGQLLLNRYKNAVFHLDQQLAELFELLTTRGVQDNTLVIVTADHGLEFNDSGLNQWGAGSSYSEYQLHVPLVIAWPGYAAHVYQEQTSHLDLVPTLMSRLLGVSSPEEDYSMGTDLFATRRKPWVLTGNPQHFVIFDTRRITEFSRQGDFQIRDRHSYRLQDDAKPDMGMLIKVMNDLQRFKASP